MSENSKDPRTRAQLLEEIEQLQLRLGEAEQTLEAIRRGDIDALVVTGPQGEQIFTLAGAEHIYRVIVETMNEAALTVDPDGTVLFCNQRFCDLMKTPIHEVIGQKVTAFVARPQQPSLRAMLTNGQVGAIQRRVTLRATDGAAVPVQISASPLQIDGTIGICLVASDLTELEASANSIRVLREHRQALEESEARFRAIFESSQDAVVIANDEGVYVQANPAVQAIFGVPPEQLIGRRISDFLGEGVDFPTVWQTFLATGSLRSEMPLTRADGQVRYVESYAIANILPGRHLSVIRDVTERKQAHEALLTANEQFRIQTEELQAQTEELQAANEELSVREEELRVSNEALRQSEERYHRLFEDDLTGDFISTAEGQILLCNPAFARIFGFSCVEEAVGTNILELYVDPTERDPLLETLRQQRIIERLEAWRKRRDGQPVYTVENLVGTLDDRGELREIKGYTFDDTDRKRAEERLRELNATLESKVARRTAELEYRAGQLQKLTLELSEAEDRERRRIAEILHDDLQQILAAARFHLNLLKSRAKRDPSQQAIADKVDDLLGDSIQKSRTLSHDLSPVVLYHGDLGEALRWLAGQVQAKHGLVVRVDAFGEVDSQSDALKAFLYKAAQEMLFNVVKHARIHEARIRVRRLGRCICLSVSDRGRGFDPRSLRETAGFGLFSIRERVELLGGRMKIRSAEGQGSTFHVVVPDGVLSKNDVDLGQGLNGAAKQAERGEGRGEHRLRVLLADDHEIVREGMASLLSGELDIEVVGEAANGREAVDLAYKLRPDVVVMDVAMPLINGDEATRQIKTHLPETRIVALSMYDEAETVERMYRAGAESYVLKTAPSDNLIAAIRLPAAGDCPTPHP